MDRAFGLVFRGCGFESRLWQEMSTTEVRPLSKAPNPQLLPGRRSAGCPLLQVCALGRVKCREHISLLVILCIIVYVTNNISIYNLITSFFLYLYFCSVISVHIILFNFSICFLNWCYIFHSFCVIPMYVCPIMHVCTMSVLSSALEAPVIRKNSVCV